MAAYSPGLPIKKSRRNAITTTRATPLKSIRARLPAANMHKIIIMMLLNFDSMTMFPKVCNHCTPRSGHAPRPIAIIHALFASQYNTVKLYYIITLLSLFYCLKYPLHFSSSRHVNILITNINYHTTNERRISLRKGKERQSGSNNRWREATRKE